MQFAILVRDLDDDGQPHRENLLATEIENGREAGRIVRNLASSFRQHGPSPSTSSFWFRDRRGLHEILAVPQV